MQGFGDHGENKRAVMTDVSVAPPHRTPPDASRPGGAHTVTRRGALPTGRAVVGGFLVALSALGIFSAYSRAAAGPTTRYVVARHDVAPGTRLTAGDLVLLPMELPDVVIDSSAFSREEALVGAIAVGQIRAGALVQAGDVVKKASGPEELEVSFAIEPARALAGTLRPGERVDVVATFGAGGESYTVTVVRQARVVHAQSDRSPLASSTTVLRLALQSSDEVLALSHALNAGEVTLARSTGTSVSGPVGQTYRAPAAARPGAPDGTDR